MAHLHIVIYSHNNWYIKGGRPWLAKYGHAVGDGTMASISELILANVVTIGAAVGAATWFLKRYLGNRIDLIFTERLKVLDFKVRNAEKYEEKMIEVITEALPNIQGVVYRSRNILRDLIRTRDSGLVEVLINNWDALADYLYKYQLFVPEESFKRIHAYKTVVYQLTLMLGSGTPESVETVNDGTIDHRTLTDKEVQTLRDHLPELNRLYEEIVKDLRNMINSRRVPAT